MQEFLSILTPHNFAMVIAGYLVYDLTKSLRGSIDKLTKSIESNNKVVTETLKQISCKLTEHDLAIAELKEQKLDEVKV